jgi:hypothetical protein
MHRLIFATLAVCTLVPALATFAQTKAKKPIKRAQPPKFTKTDTFYADAFKEGLVGERPADLSQPAGAAAASGKAAGGASVPATAANGASAAAGTGWSALISPTTIEDSIKELKLQVDKEVTTASDFAGKGHKLARRDYSLLAMLFGIAGEYEGDVRWKKDAPVARDAFARSAANFKVGTPQAHQEAKVRKEELTDLVGGSSPYAGKTAEVKANWGQVANRAPLMQHLESVWEPRLKPALADKAKFTASADKLLHDAELFAAIGEVLAKEGMEDADSDEYKAFCNRLRDGAKAIIDAVKSKNYEQATSAGAAIGKACTECHENYRA